jgi:ABC-type sugar transport system ATPase subunit
MVSEVTENELVSMMVGRQITNLYGASDQLSRSKEAYFHVEGLSRKKVFENISFSLKRGEILGLAGLVGAGRTELGRAIFGAERIDAGRIFLNGKEIAITGTENAIRKQIAYLTEDRKAFGLFLSMPVRENLIAPSLRKFTSPSGFIQSRKVDSFAHGMVEEYAIVTPSIYKKVLNLSGGNQQKCLVAMWMGIRPEVIIFDEPTRGVDVGARAEIYQKLREVAAGGTGIIMISSDLPELIGMCDRIIVMHHGRITGELEREDFTEERILSYAAGLNDKEISNPLSYPGTPENR